MIYVVGCPSGGTSAVAGLLSVLGVAMTKKPQATPTPVDAKRRPDTWKQAKWWHNTYECSLMFGLADEYWKMNTPFFGWNPIRSKSILDTYRRERCSEDGPIGVKDVRLGALLCDSPPTSNDQLVIVDRSLESSCRSWVRRAVRLGTKQQFDHIGFVAQCHWFKDHLASQHGCIRISYEELLDDPKDAATFLALALKLDEGKIPKAVELITNYKGESFA